MKRFVYLLWQIVWGLPQTTVGLLVFLSLAGRPHFLHHGAIVTVWRPNAGLALGPFVFINERGALREDEPSDRVLLAKGCTINDRLLVHEYGHTVQSLILGPLYLPVIGLPSVLWMKVPALKRRRREGGLSYYTFYTERWANHLGELALGRKSMGQAVID